MVERSGRSPPYSARMGGWLPNRLKALMPGLDGSRLEELAGAGSAATFLLALVSLALHRASS